MKKTQWAFTILFFAVLIFLPVSFLINSLFVASSEESMYLQEKRGLEQLPTLEDNILTWPNQIELYFKDHLPWRGAFTLLNANINYNVFNTITSEQVILGKENWMFFKDYNEVTNISDYQGITTITPEECEHIYNNLNNFAISQLEKDRKTVLFLVPNKEQIYGHYLPDGIEQINSVSRADTLLDYISNQQADLLLADPKQELLLTAQNDDGIYFKYDSHWTPAGCYISLKVLLGTLDIKLNDYNRSDYYFTNKYFSGDLGAMAGLFTLESEPIYRADSGYTGTISESVATYNENLKIYTSNAPNNQRVLVLGDSFRFEMENQLSDYYTKVGYLDITKSSASVIDEFNPDIIIIEQVERNINQLSMPIM